MGVDCASATVGPCINGLSNSNFNGTPMTSSNGVNANINLNPVLDELGDAELAINDLAGDILLDFNLDGIWDTDLTISLGSGLTVFDFLTGGNDLSLTFENLLIDGPFRQGCRGGEEGSRAPSRSSAPCGPVQDRTPSIAIAVTTAGTGRSPRRPHPS
ncbi:MAG: hypothetical protein ABFS46_00920 [Myxococcota bacterium]